MSEERLDDIEAKLAFQEHTIHELNDVIYQQQKKIDQLELTSKMLIERLTDISEALPQGKAQDEKPPHY